jgi:cytochrome c-type biogenesis protein CcmH/NrfG
MVYQAGKLSLAWYWENSGQPAKQIRAAELVPGNAEAWARLGEATEYSLDQTNPSLAISYYIRAVRINPLSAPNWIELANGVLLNRPIGVGD